jgi:hypothetical protein
MKIFFLLFLVVSAAVDKQLLDTYLKNLYKELHYGKPLHQPNVMKDMAHKLRLQFEAEGRLSDFGHMIAEIYRINKKEKELYSIVTPVTSTLSSVSQCHMRISSLG